MYAFLALTTAMLLHSGGATGHALECPSGTSRHSFAYSSGEKKWCARPNGLRHGPAGSYYSNGQLLFSGEYVDGAADGIAVYYLNEGTLWRRDTWNEGALISKVAGNDGAQPKTIGAARRCRRGKR